MIDIINLWSDMWARLLWKVTWQGGVFMVAIFLITKTFRRLSSTVRHLLWMVVIVKFLVMPFVMVPITLPAVLTVDQKQVAELSPTLAPKKLLPTTQIVKSKTTIHGASLLFFSWAVGVVVLLLGIISRSLKLKRNIYTAKILEDKDILHMVEEQVRELRIKTPLVKVSDKFRIPFACGILHPTLVFPKHIIENFTPSELRAIITHELAHIKRLDTFTNLVQILTQIFYFFNPSIWYTNRRIRVEREQACDDWVLQIDKKDRKTYADALLKVVEFCPSSKGFALNIVGISESFTLMARRLKMIMNAEGKINTKISFTLIIGLILIGLIAIPAYYTTTDKPQALLKEKVFNDNFDNFIVYVDKIEGGRLEGVRIWELLPKGPPRVITAQEGEFITRKDKDTLILRLGKGTIEQVYEEKDSVKYHKMDFTNHFIKLTCNRSS